MVSKVVGTWTLCLDLAPKPDTCKLLLSSLSFFMLLLIPHPLVFCDTDLACPACDRSAWTDIWKLGVPLI